MAFAPDHNDVDRVFDAERKIALSRWVRDAPVDERWFRLEFDDVGVVLKARWSMQDDGNRGIYTFDGRRLEEALAHARAWRRSDRALTEERWRESLLPAAREAILYLEAATLPPALKAHIAEPTIIFET